MKLTEEQEAFIRKTLESEGVNLPTLRDDLLDHLCCAVEIKMERNREFDQALHEAIRELAPDGLKAIETQTIFLLNKRKVNTMKLITYLIGFIASATLCMGWLFNILHWSGAQEIALAGYVGLFLIYLPLLAVLRYRDLVSGVVSERLKFILGLSAALLAGISLVMKFVHLNDMIANTLIILGFVVFMTGFLPMLFFTMYRKSA